MEDVMANTILKELREFRAENNKRWEANDKRWEEKILDTMQKTTNNQLIICVHEKRLNSYNARINNLEKWKDKFDMGEYTAV